MLTAAGARGPSYLTEGRLTKLGSGLLHLGFIVFAIVVAALQGSTFMLSVFWVATALTIGGTAAELLRRPPRVARARGRSRSSTRRGPRPPS